MKRPSSAFGQDAGFDQSRAKGIDALSLRSSDRSDVNPLATSFLEQLGVILESRADLVSAQRAQRAEARMMPDDAVEGVERCFPAARKERVLRDPPRVSDRGPAVPDGCFGFLTFGVWHNR